MNAWLLVVALSSVTSFPNNLDSRVPETLTSFETELLKFQNPGFPEAWKRLPAEWTPRIHNHRRNAFRNHDMKNGIHSEAPTSRRKRFLESLLYPFARPSASVRPSAFIPGVRRRRPLRRRGRRPIYGRPFYYFSPSYAYSITPYYDSYDFASGYSDDFDYNHDYALDYGFDGQYIEYDDYGGYGTYEEGDFGDSNDYDISDNGDYGDYGGGGFGDYGSWDLDGAFDSEYLL